MIVQADRRGGGVDLRAAKCGEREESEVSAENFVARVKEYCEPSGKEGIVPLDSAAALDLLKSGKVELSRSQAHRLHRPAPTRSLGCLRA